MIFLKNKSIEDFFQTSLKMIINILIIYIIIILLLGLGKTVCSIKDLFPTEDFANRFSQVITDILSFLVILELFRSFIEYFKAKRFRLHSMMDPLIIFVIRELIVILYAHEKVTWQNLVGFSALIFSIGIVRTLAVIFSPKLQ
ncbi:MAG: phosphate-starvation-inducible PsiE family protein [Desulfobacterales bacterium]|nr:phosphate-starvation-inducible PsiE family protein [Desulfobacterales bacterium]